MRGKISHVKTLTLTFMSLFKNTIDNGYYYMIVVCECYVGQYVGGITDKGIHTYINTIVTHATGMLAIDIPFLYNLFKT